MNNNPIQHITSCRLPTEFGVFQMHGFVDTRTPNEFATPQEHVALVLGDVGNGKPVLSRIHSECLTGDAFLSQKCDCGPQLQAAMQAVQAEGRGVIVYLRQEGRGIGLINKIRAYALQDKGMDTVEANLALHLPVDARDFSIAKHIYEHLGVSAIRLLTNNPEKLQTMHDCGIEIAERVPLKVGENPENAGYLSTKADKLNHLL
ncbi:GTP cyclohydrolase II [Kingella kingae]|nr:GTP cyclohydrolase II [Kingella kingae]MDK4528172.1 GTP cyclohydrolase II [Kingella kingae]MDK4534304.1 GTP cyclohydrolase II [Kingella kingae]MDK4540762.1 GTP cyclohydrolase II [Kingella kingae]MDK4542746.1 GTP cyclohydrolase II [Kingella kingae]MDK4553873.1 GTP cyclohydrolase II [Kingella kingae]